MDLDAVLARAPKAALVDELARTNVPGSSATPSRGRTWHSPAGTDFHSRLALARRLLELPCAAVDWLEQVAKLRQWTSKGVRAPHKPLLLLYALGSFQRDADSELRYSVVEGDLKRLLAEYGPANPTSPAYPFHHLARDGVWEVRTDHGPGSPGSGIGQLRSTGATGRLAPELRAALVREPSLLGRIARVLLDTNFPTSLHPDLCEAVGLDLESTGGDTVSAASAETVQARRQRDRRMRELVLTAYEYQCAFCGYDGLLEAGTVGLEAAHVRWWAFDGPDAVDNGLCLCSLHHKLFDKGVLSLAADHRIVVSQHFVGRSEASRQQVLALAGRPVIGPQAGQPHVSKPYRDWHFSQVFRGIPRPPAAPSVPTGLSR